jgi:transcriptional regulator with XRE-family HTH domain
MHEIPANLLTVVKKRSRNPELSAFGGWLETLRGGMSRERVSQRLSDKGVSLGGSTLAQYEKGTVWAPDVGVLQVLAHIYDVPFEQLARGVVENRKNTALSTAVLIELVRSGTEPTHDRADPSHANVAPEKNDTSSERMTRPDIHPDVKQHLSVSTGGINDAAAAGAGSADRLPESKAARDVEMRARFTVAKRDELLQRLEAGIAHIQSVAGALRAAPSTPSARGKRSAGAGGVGAHRQGGSRGRRS